jgi:hypothetical protein
MVGCRRRAAPGHPYEYNLMSLYPVKNIGIWFRSGLLVYILLVLRTDKPQTHILHTALSRRYIHV